MDATLSHNQAAPDGGALAGVGLQVAVKSIGAADERTLADRFDEGLLVLAGVSLGEELPEERESVERA